MKQIILIDDIQDRQRIYTKNLNIESYSDILDNMIDDKYREIYCKLKSNNCSLNYAIVMVHLSAFEAIDNRKLIETIEKHCRLHNIKLIFFSGSTSSLTFMKDPDIMYINDKIFYENFEEFLKNCRNGKINLQILGYGKKWKINLLHTTLKIVNRIIDNCEYPMHFETFKTEINYDLLEELIQDLSSLKIDNRIDHSQLKKIQAYLASSLAKHME